MWIIWDLYLEIPTARTTLKSPRILSECSRSVPAPPRQCCRWAARIYIPNLTRVQPHANDPLCPSEQIHLMQWFKCNKVIVVVFFFTCRCDLHGLKDVTKPGESGWVFGILKSVWRMWNEKWQIWMLSSHFLTICIWRSWTQHSNVFPQNHFQCEAVSLWSAGMHYSRSAPTNQCHTISRAALRVAWLMVIERCTRCRIKSTPSGTISSYLSV